jgi:two-component system, OmpR family, sensor histidine kinase KdpD
MEVRMMNHSENPSQLRQTHTSPAEKLLSALLTSISHDLRTPLASVLGSATSLRNYRHTLDDTTQEELIGTIQEEAERLNRFIANLLDMTRLEVGAIEPRAELMDVGDIVGSALERARKVLARHRVAVDLSSDLPMLRLDPVLFEQVLFNLLDNTAKYAPAGTQVQLSARQEGGMVRVAIADEGEGIPPADLERIFDKFYRVEVGDTPRVGTGLGLAICRGFIEPMGGTIVAGNRPDRHGAVFTIALRVPAEQMSTRDRARISDQC